MNVTSPCSFVCTAAYGGSTERIEMVLNLIWNNIFWSRWQLSITSPKSLPFSLLYLVLVMAFDPYVATLWSTTLKDLPKTILIPILCSLFLLRNVLPSSCAFKVKWSRLMEWFSYHHCSLFPPEIGIAQWNCWLRQSELRYAWSGLPCSFFILIYLLIHIHGQHSLNRHGFVSGLVHHHPHPHFYFLSFLFCPIFLLFSAIHIWSLKTFWSV
jgi:hypothetical protein